MPGWDRHGLERLARYCARPPLSQERLDRLDKDTLVYSLRRPTVDGRTELLLTPHQLLDRLARLVKPPRRHKHRYCGVLAPNARLRAAVTASAGPAGSTLQVLEQVGSGRRRGVRGRDGGWAIRGELRRNRRSDGQAACRPGALGSTIRGIQAGWAGVVGAKRRLFFLFAGG